MRKGNLLLLITMISVNSVTPTILNDVLDLIPFDKIKQVMREHSRFDEGFNAAVFFVKTPQFLELENNILQQPEFQTFAMTGRRYGLDVYQMVRESRNFINSLVVPSRPAVEPDYSLLMKDIQPLLPIFQIGSLFLFEPDNPEEKRVRAELTSPATKRIVVSLLNNPLVQRLKQTFIGMKLNVDMYLNLAFEMLGWN